MNILLPEDILLSAEANESDFYITGVTGLGAADIRTSSFLFSGRSGGMVTDQLLGFRNISVNGVIGKMGGSRLEHEQDRAALMAALPIGTTFPVYIKNFAGNTYRIDCNLLDLKLEYKQRGYLSDYLLQLTAGDPYFYTTDGGDEQSITIERVSQGGYITPYILPVEWAEGGTPKIVTNSGDANYYPIITLHDEALNPTITNQATGETMGLNLSMLDGDEVVIDMRERTITLNGSDILGNKTDDSVWWALLPGNNPILLDSDTADDTITATLTWRNGVRGI